MAHSVLAGEHGCVQRSHRDPSISFRDNQPESDNKNELVFYCIKDNLVFYHSSGEVYGDHYSINYIEQLFIRRLFTTARR
jgi:hypothetical protein